MNAVINRNRTNVYLANKLKKDNEAIIKAYILKSKVKKVENYPIDLKIKWYEKDRRRDADNVYSAIKFILDAMVDTGVIAGDSRKYVRNISNEIYVDKDNPRIEVEIKEKHNEKKDC